MTTRTVITRAVKEEDACGSREVKDEVEASSKTLIMRLFITLVRHCLPLKMVIPKLSYKRY